jgi:adenylosuccinate lyase
MVKLTEKYADTPQIGRTHGQHAVPITFGFAMAEYVARFGKSIRSLEVLQGQLMGKFSGAVGAYNAISLFVDDPLAFEKSYCDKLGLEVARYSNQIVPPGNLLRVIAEITILSGAMANLATDMRHLQRTEIGEIREKFEADQTGSSTMAHKRNPISFENVASLHKQVLAQQVNANQNMISEHQRDLTDSASARFYAVSFATVAVMLERLNAAMGKIEVDEEAMQRNLEMSGGAIAAEPLYLLLAKYGHTSAHEKSKELAHSALDSGKTLVEVIVADKEAKPYWDKFNETEQRIIHEPQKYYLGLASEKARSLSRKV